MLGHSMADKLYCIYSNASDVAIGASLQQVQPISVRDLKGTKIYDKILAAHMRGEPVPKLAHQASKNTNNMPEPNPWAEDIEDTIVHIE
jgi:hypothetical protein